MLIVTPHFLNYDNLTLSIFKLLSCDLIKLM